MPRTSSNSLKGKIWLATSGLAFFICSFGLISYIIVSTLTDDPFYAVFIPFLFLAFAVMVFGWWLANEIISPIEKVSLLAKSLERGATTTLPKTTGSAETDELLQTLYRNSQQIRHIVNLMDEVSAGNFAVALTPLQNSDRLTNSFQQLLGKVSESIHAHQNLEKLQAEIRQIKDEIAPVKKGNLNVEIKSDFAETKEISETFRYLINHLNEIIAHVRTDARLSQNSVGEIQKAVSAFVSHDEARMQEMQQTARALKQIPMSVHKISEDLANSALQASQTIEKAKTGARSAQANLAVVSQLRKQIQDAIKQIQKLGERSQEIEKVAKTISDLTRRTNMIALNASIQSEKSGENAHGGIRIIVEEIERLATRADEVNRHISGFNKSMSAEINQTETLLHATTNDAANLSKFAIETSNSLNEMEKYVSQFLNLQNNLTAYSQEKYVETEMAFQIFANSISEAGNTVKILKDADASFKQTSKTLENLHASVLDFKTAEIANNFTSFTPAAFEENYADTAFEENA